MKMLVSQNTLLYFLDSLEIDQMIVQIGPEEYGPIICLAFNR